MNNLPKYWIVKRDATNPNWKKVIEYLNKTYGYSWLGNQDAYYGYDGNDEHMLKGTNYWDSISKFKNNPTELTIDEFVAMTDGEQFTRGEVVGVRDRDYEDWIPLIYLTTVQGSEFPHVCVRKGNEEKFKNNDPFRTTPFRQIRKLQQSKTVVNLKVIAEKLFL